MFCLIEPWYSMDFPRDSEIVYGGDMCNRRLRGIKVNPIYQEKEAPGESEANGSIPIGEIQIDMYESLPRKRRILQYSPDAVLLGPSGEDGKTTSTHFTHIATDSLEKCNNCNSSLERSCRCRESVRKQKNRTTEAKSVSDTVGMANARNDSVGQIKTILSSNLNGNSTSHYTDKIRHSGSRDSQCVSDENSINSCEREHTPKDLNGNEDGNNIRQSNTCHEGKIAVGVISNTDKAILFKTSNIIPSETVVAYATTEHPNPQNIYSFNSFSHDLSDVELTLKEHTNKLYGLEHITDLPSYSDIHHALPVCPIDFINNNHETMPDQMVILHNSIQSDDSSSIKALQLLSDSISADHDKGGKKQNGVVSPPVCDCYGKPTLKCVCGRKALQKLLRQKHLIKSDNGSNESLRVRHGSIQEDLSVCIEGVVSIDEPSESIYSTSYSDNQGDIIEEIDSSPEHNSFTIIEEEDKANASKSILLTGNRRGSRIQECRTIKFAKGTVFNESKTTKYAKERRRPAVSDDVQLKTLSNGNLGTDNPVFITDDGIIISDSVFYDETSFQQGIDSDFSINDNSNTLTRLQDGSLILKAEDLNVPAYMDSYIRSLSNLCDANKNKAPLVSIEALGGMTVVDYTDIEVADDDEYNRRRRKHKNDCGNEGDEWLRKNRRKKNIKIYIIIFVVIAAICTGIGLGIHFGGEPSTPDTVGNPTLDKKSSDVSRFGLAIFK